MRQLVWRGPGRMDVVDAPRPSPGPGAVVVQSLAAGICGSELEGYLGRMSNRLPPLVMGHEFAGRVVELGPGVAAGWEGRPVAVNPIVGCGSCAPCLAGERHLCPDRHLLGIAVPGGFAGFAAVPEACLFEMPETMDWRLGALVEPLANGVHCVRRALAGTAAESALVLGAGTIGLACLQAARLAGVGSVEVVERHPARREHALRLGAAAAHADLGRAPGGAELVIDAVGAEATRRAAAELVRPSGTCAFIGLHDDRTALEWHPLIRGNVRVQGVFGYADRDFQQALDWLAEGRAGIGPLSPPRSLEEGPAVFAELAAGPTAEIKVFLAEDPTDGTR